MTKNQCLKFKFMISFMVFAIQMVYCHHAKKCNDEFVTVTLAGRHRIRGQSQQTIYGDKTYVAFKGIPFAEAPVGQLRFKVSKMVMVYIVLKSILKFGKKDKLLEMTLVSLVPSHI